MRSEQWVRNIASIAPFVLVRLLLIQSSVREFYPPVANLPECESLFRAKPQSTVDFKKELDRFRDKCNKFDSKAPCNVYFPTQLASISALYSKLYPPPSRLPRLDTFRGGELVTCLENPNHVGLEHSRSVFVRYLGESGIDAGGLTKEFYIQVCRQLKPLFSALNPTSRDPRMYISRLPDQQIIKRLNRDIPSDKRQFTVADLPGLYTLAGRIFVDALLNNYSTELPLSRVLLGAMTSKDTSVKLSYVKTAYLMERDPDNSGYDPLDQIYLFDIDDPKESEASLDYVARSTFLLDPENPKKAYVADFINGFRSMSTILGIHKIIPSELFSRVCSSNVTVR
jgi:hypothetical protein